MLLNREQWAHLIVGCLIGTAVGVLCLASGVDTTPILLVAPLAVASVIGIAKEMWDGCTSGEVKVLDFAALVIGGGMAATLMTGLSLFVL